MLTGYISEVILVADNWEDSHVRTINILYAQSLLVSHPERRQMRIKEFGPHTRGSTNDITTVKPVLG